MRDLVATRGFVYQTRRLKAGDPFTASDAWGRALVAARMAAPYSSAPGQEPPPAPAQEAPEPPPPVEQPPPEPATIVGALTVGALPLKRPRGRPRKVRP